LKLRWDLRNNVYMTYSIRKKIFWKGTKSEKHSLSLSKPMSEALKGLADQVGDSVPNLIAEVLEQFLVQMVKDGMIKLPPGEEDTFKELTANDGEKVQAS
jgi:hypothetical protein